MLLEHGEKALNTGGQTKITMFQKTFSAEQRESTLAGSLWSARGYTVQNGGLSIKKDYSSPLCDVVRETGCDVFSLPFSSFSTQ